MKRKGEKVLKPVHPNAGIAAEYRRKLDELINIMSASYERRLRAVYRANPPEMAQDARRPRVTAVQGALQQKRDSTGRVISSGPERWWHVFVDGEMLRQRNGVGREFRSQLAAEEAGRKAARVEVDITEPVSIGNRFDPETLAALPLAPSPADALRITLDGLGAEWTARIDAAAPKLARWFTQSAGSRSQAQLKKILADGGMSVKFQMSPAMRDIVDATLAENVSLIKSIGSQYHTDVEGLVMRSVTAGRDLGALTQALEHRYGVTRRRAAFIALDQNNKATGAMVAARQVELGLTAIWLHSTAGKVPRPTHLANSGKPYDPAVGWFDPDPRVKRFIRPGELPRCRCVSRTVVKGFS